MLWQMGLLHTSHCMTTYLQLHTETKLNSNICRACIYFWWCDHVVMTDNIYSVHVICSIKTLLTLSHIWYESMSLACLLTIKLSFFSLYLKNIYATYTSDVYKHMGGFTLLPVYIEVGFWFTSPFTVLMQQKWFTCWIVCIVLSAGDMTSPTDSCYVL